MNTDEIIASFQKIAAMARAEIDLLDGEDKERGPLLLIETEALASLSRLNKRPS